MICTTENINCAIVQLFPSLWLTPSFHTSLVQVDIENLTGIMGTLVQTKFLCKWLVTAGNLEYTNALHHSCSKGPAQLQKP